MINRFCSAPLEIAYPFHSEFRVIEAQLSNAVEQNRFPHKSQQEIKSI